MLIGATPEGRKELVGFTDGARESAQDWRDLLLELKRRGLDVPPRGGRLLRAVVSGRRSRQTVTRFLFVAVKLGSGSSREGFATLLFLTSWDRAWGGRGGFGRWRGASKFRRVRAVAGPKLGPFNRPDELAAHWLFRLHLGRRLVARFGRWSLSECGRRKADREGNQERPHSYFPLAFCPRGTISFSVSMRV